MLSNEEIARVKNAILEAEKQTSGEIRVCVSKRCKGNPVEHAVKKFHALKMNETALRNAVLIFVCPNHHKAAIVGDQGIDSIAGENFWNGVLAVMFSHFRRDAVAVGICEGITMVGDLIKNKFPVSENDKNELSDEIIWDDEA